jgi:hypothetical protein
LKTLYEITQPLKELVTGGIYDPITKRMLQVRIICSLGDNLEQNPICGLLANFSSTEYCCRKCLLSRTILCTAKNYEEIHRKDHVSRTNENINAHYEKAQEKEVY